MDSKFLSELQRSIEQAQATTLTIARWLDRTREMQDALSWKVLSLSNHIDQLPESTYASYADALLNALQDTDLSLRNAEQIQEVAEGIRIVAGRLSEIGMQDKAAGLSAA